MERLPRVGLRVSRVKALILITLILAFSLEGRRDKTFYDTFLSRRGFYVANGS